jgi:hypothetical protein
MGQARSPLSQFSSFIAPAREVSLIFQQAANRPSERVGRQSHGLIRVGEKPRKQNVRIVLRPSAALTGRLPHDPHILLLPVIGRSVALS